MRCYWDEEDVWFYFEVDAGGWVTRQIELQGPELTPIAAASLNEWQQAHEPGRLDEYDNRFGITAELPVSEWEGHDPEQLPRVLQVAERQPQGAGVALTAKPPPATAP